MTDYKTLVMYSRRKIELAIIIENTDSSKDLITKLTELTKK
jgi:hypothetical protein